MPKKYTVDLTPAAIRGIDRALLWYAERSEQAAQKFWDKALDTLKRIEQHPLTARQRAKEYRIKLIPTYPYAFIYRIEEERVVVYNCMHLHSNYQSDYELDVE